MDECNILIAFSAIMDSRMKFMMKTWGMWHLYIVYYMSYIYEKYTISFKHEGHSGNLKVREINKASASNASRPTEIVDKKNLVDVMILLHMRQQRQIRDQQN